MFDIEIVEKKGIKVIDSKLLHKKLEVRSYHKDWIRRRIENYQFEEGIDYYLEQRSNLSGGKKSKNYLISLDMAKELAMLENNDIGKATRKYFIKCEKEFRKTEAIRLAGIQVRKSLTSAVQESGENDRMHGRGYGNYTKMVYEVCGVRDQYIIWKDTKKKMSSSFPSFRDWITPSELKRVELAESLIKPLLELDKQYSEIKDTLKPLFEKKEIK